MIITKTLQLFQPVKQCVSSARAPIEVMGLGDADFLGLEQIAPGHTWEDLLTDAWGLPSVATGTIGADRPVSHRA
jgi:hypothetical protein